RSGPRRQGLGPFGAGACAGAPRRSPGRAIGTPSPRERGEGSPARKLGLAEVVVGLFVALAFDRFGLVVGIKDHSGESTIIAIVTPPPGSEHRLVAVRASAGRRLALEGGLKPRYRAAKNRWGVHMNLLTMF